MNARQILLLGGVALAILGMGYGLWYAVFAEHQALDGIGRSLSSGFQAAAARDSAAADKALLQYREAKYAYDRQVDVHGHWIGLSMLLIVLAVGSDQLALPGKWKLRLAWIVVLGSALFPSGVLMQTWSHGTLPKAVTILGSSMVIAGLAGMTRGLLGIRTADAPGTVDG